MRLQAMLIGALALALSGCTFGGSRPAPVMQFIPESPHMGETFVVYGYGGWTHPVELWLYPAAAGSAFAKDERDGTIGTNAIKLGNAAPNADGTFTLIGDLTASGRPLAAGTYSFILKDGEFGRTSGSVEIIR